MGIVHAKKLYNIIKLSKNFNMALQTFLLSINIDVTNNISQAMPSFLLDNPIQILCINSVVYLYMYTLQV